MPDPFTGAVASEIADSIVATVASRIKGAIFGSDERRALDQAVSRALQELAEDMPGLVDAAGSLPIELYFGHSDVAAMLADSAFAGTEPHRDEVGIRLAALGYDDTTSPVDLVAAVVDFSSRLAAESGETPTGTAAPCSTAWPWPSSTVSWTAFRRHRDPRQPCCPTCPRLSSAATATSRPCASGSSALPPGPEAVP